ncbi:threonine transporter RhtB [Rhizobiales bacterium RZME27]|uniref:Threonine transporter RhtB n=1 Tax=Endobacterium cereale TaxID=2663029 RepID=A0A6A8A7W1_9HYPH|nr:threonine transporter RhtB [Endobacterium cereale]MEB2845019.1 threonine transporter RhtB [Endobacterium cereale]MQY44931.1 threonine transporter RhtB [Endobacterium cereale]
MTPLQFTLAILLLLCTPGPTNTLMALGGYARGWARALPLIGGELGGYLLVIVPVATLAAPFFQAYPQASLIAKIAAVLWVLYLSIRLWASTKKTDEASGQISIRQVFVTTVLNPKALIIALVIMPHGNLMTLSPWLLLFAGLVLFAANGWIIVGSLMRGARGFEIKPVVIRRVAAVCLLLFAIILASSSIQSLA